MIGAYRGGERIETLVEGNSYWCGGTPTGGTPQTPGTSQIAPPADLSGLGEWHDEIVAAGIAEDRERYYRKAVRGYVQAGLRAFDQARKGAA